MDSHLLYELIGYLASILIAVSLTMRSVLKLRVINLIGAACFTVYGLLITAYPVASLNGLIVANNLYYLYEMKRAKNYFTIVETRHDAQYLHAFLRFYAEDIKHFFPSTSPRRSGICSGSSCEISSPVGLFIAEPHRPGRLFVDYVIPGYRDLRPGAFLYEQQAERFKAHGITHLKIIPETDAQRDYVKRMRFAPTTPTSSEGETVYRRSIQ